MLTRRTSYVLKGCLILAIVLIGASRFLPVLVINFGKTAKSSVILREDNASAANSAIADGLSLQRSAWVETNANPFRATSFLPPLAVTPVSAQAPKVEESKPSAPSFPYEFLGRMIDVNGNALTFLMRNGDLIPVKVGEVLDGIYRIDAVDAQQIRITFLPSNEQSTLIAKTAEH